MYSHYTQPFTKNQGIFPPSVSQRVFPNSKSTLASPRTVSYRPAAPLHISMLWEWSSNYIIFHQVHYSSRCCVLVSDLLMWSSCFSSFIMPMITITLLGVLFHVQLLQLTINKGDHFAPHSLLLQLFSRANFIYMSIITVSQQGTRLTVFHPTYICMRLFTLSLSWVRVEIFFKPTFICMSIFTATQLSTRRSSSKAHLYFQDILYVISLFQYFLQHPTVVIIILIYIQHHQSIMCDWTLW